MLSKNQIKEIRALHIKKNREERGLFIAETPKIVDDIIKSSLEIANIFATQQWMDENSMLIKKYNNVVEISKDELGRISLLQQANKVLAIVRAPVYSWKPNIMEKEIVLMLDKIQDPGNLGTIIRLADWFGIEHIICSTDCVESFNPKVVQATMGSIARVKIHYFDIVEFLESIKKNISVYGTYLDGENIYHAKLNKTGIIVIGSEGNGISNEVSNFINKKICIPSFSKDSKDKAESLNAAIATAIVFSEFKRRNIT